MAGHGGRITRRGHPMRGTWGVTGLVVVATLLAAARAGAGPGPSEKAAVALAAEVARRLEARWKEHGVPPAAPADDAEFLRRAYLDLAGHIPPITEVRDFLDDRDPNKRRKLVNNLLAGERHA